MLLKTHVSTALALSIVIDNYLSHSVESYSSNLLIRFFVIAVSVILQYIIDITGHKWKNIGGRSVPVRNMLHSIITLVAMSIIVGFGPAYITKTSRVILVPLSATLLHWAEDLVTEGGVYVFNTRIRLPFRVSYDNPGVNRVTVFLFMIVLAMYAKPFESLFNFVMSSIAVASLVYTFLSV